MYEISSATSMELKITTSIREVIDRAIGFSELPQDVRHECEAIDDADSVSWRLIQTVCKFVREREPGDRGGPWLWQVAEGSRLVLKPPPEKQRSPELLARLERLRKEDEERRYNAMVNDITRSEREAEEKRNAVLPTTRLQLSFGAHMLVMMLTFYLLFFYGARSFFDSPALHHALGAIGIFAALLMETVLYISRTSIDVEGGRKYLDLLGRPRQPVPPPSHPFTAFTTAPVVPKLKAS